ncbi:MAG: peptidyl-prolyl cis-trans isomerase [Alphaproteobacteria bacterium]|nr:peptidyl-prolyl cis-trans isomerase [Alphaproteobacteria bacterium]
MNHLPVPPLTAPRRRGLIATLAAAAILVTAGLAAFSQSGPPAGAPAGAQPGPDSVIAKVNGVEIRQSDLAMAEEDVGQSLPQQGGEDAKRDYLVSYLTDMILLAQNAEQKRLQDGDDFKRHAAFARNKALMETLLQTEGKKAISDQALHAVYDDAVKQMGDEEEVHARHILFRVANPSDEKASKEAEDKIKAVIERVKKGEDFATLAKELTEDPAGRQDGGDLGYFTKDQMVPEFAEVAFKLANGAISDPVKSQFGWHIIKVEDKRDRQPPEFDKVKEQIEQYLVRRQQAELITKLRAAAKIDRVAPPAAPAAPAPAAPPAEQKK